MHRPSQNLPRLIGSGPLQTGSRSDDWRTAGAQGRIGTNVVLEGARAPTASREVPRNASLGEELGLVQLELFAELTAACARVSLAYNLGTAGRVKSASG